MGVKSSKKRTPVGKRKTAAGKPETEQCVAVSVEELVAALGPKALKGNVSAVNLLLKLGALKRREPEEAEQVLLELVEKLLARPELCGVRVQENGIRSGDEDEKNSERA